LEGVQKKQGKKGKKKGSRSTGGSAGKGKKLCIEKLTQNRKTETWPAVLKPNLGGEEIRKETLGFFRKNDDQRTAQKGLGKKKKKDWGLKKGETA